MAVTSESRMLVTGGWTLIGAAIVQSLRRHGVGTVLAPSAEDCPPTDGAAVDAFFRSHRPTHVFVAAGRSGGITANQRYPADLMLDNLESTIAVIRAAVAHRVEKLLYLGSSCCYPAACPQPMQVEHLGTGQLEPTSAAYATAKLAGIQLCQAMRRQHGVNFIAGIPADVFGPYSTFDPENSHVIPALIARMHAATVAGDECLQLWGSGRPRREFLFADDLADACILAMERYESADPINLGGGTELSIADAAAVIAEVVGFNGRVECDTSKPDGVARKLLDSSVLYSLGWEATTSFRDAVQITYSSFLGGVLQRPNAGYDLPRRGAVGHIPPALEAGS